MAALVRMDPLRALAHMRQDMERMINGGRNGDGLETTFADAVWSPRVNISETNDHYVITADLPGMRKEDIKVTYDNGVLTIQGERKQEVEEKDEKLHRVERLYGMFERSFRLPMSVQADKIQAEFKDGVLRLTLPKAEDAKPRQISINVN